MATRPRGNSYLTEFMLKGARYRATFDRYEDGERWETEVRHAIKMGKPIPPAKEDGRVRGGSIKTFRQVADYTIKHSLTDNPDYKAVVSRIAKEIGEFLGEHTPMSAIRRPEIDNLIAFWREKGNSGGTVNRKLSALSAIFRTANDLDICERPAWPKRQKESDHKLRFVYPHEEEKLIETARSFGDEELADLIAFAIDTGARFSEIQRARWDWFQPGMKSWIIWIRKADNPMGMPLTKRVTKMLERRKHKHGGPFKDARYWSVRHRLNRVLEALELEDITFHTFRHTTASRLVQRGVDLRRVQMWMGHEAIATTIRYAKLAPNSLQDVADVLEAA